ncbi:helix-turn-helix domain-containing protein [Streptomyces sp. NPDC051453]|uniref:helix-turn-helix domain-containing protein n=1 Tax=Streptomyces sp. NPDC051453 TaxID=3154941 RepID=UPI003430F787
MHHVRRFLYQSSGVRLAAQHRSVRHLTGAEREEISRGIAAGESARQLAQRLGRSASTVSREIARNGGRDRYRAASADAAAYARGRRPKQAKPSRAATIGDHAVSREPAVTCTDEISGRPAWEACSRKPPRGRRRLPLLSSVFDQESPDALRTPGWSRRRSGGRSAPGVCSLAQCALLDGAAYARVELVPDQRRPLTWR